MKIFSGPSTPESRLGFFTVTTFSAKWEDKTFEPNYGPFIGWELN
jgi:hypothetical protein